MCQDISNTKNECELSLIMFAVHFYTQNKKNLIKNLTALFNILQVLHFKTVRKETGLDLSISVV